jgi:hypothetical protein
MMNAAASAPPVTRSRKDSAGHDWTPLALREPGEPPGQVDGQDPHERDVACLGWALRTRYSEADDRASAKSVASLRTPQRPGGAF